MLESVVLFYLYNNDNDNNNDDDDNNQLDKYASFCNTHLFYHTAYERASTWHNMAIELSQEIGRHITMVTEDTKETTYL